jgi:hypothetical protein
MREVPLIIYTVMENVKISFLIGYLALCSVNLLLLFISIVTFVFFGVTIRVMKKEEYSQIETLNAKTMNLEQLGLKN